MRHYPPPIHPLMIATMFEQQDLVRLARMRMPFGKYQGRLLIDLPEAYLLWFEHQGLPEGKLGQLLQLALEIKRNGVAYLIQPLRREGE